MTSYSFFFGYFELQLNIFCFLFFFAFFICFDHLYICRLANFGMNADRFDFDLCMLAVFTVVGYVLALPLLAISHRRICKGRSSGSNGGSGEQQLNTNGANDANDINDANDANDTNDANDANDASDDDGSAQRVRLSSSTMNLPLLSGNSSTSSEQKTMGQLNGEGETKTVHEDHILSFADVNSRVAGRQILANVHGEINTAEDGVFAILGPSGAGKTSLLDIIAGRKNVGTFSGHISVDGVEFSSIRTRKSIFGYVMQDETLVSDLSVRESLIFSATLRLCGTNAQTGCMPNVHSIVRQVLFDLQIDQIADSRIGNIHGDSQTRGISGGERKRVAIGMELVVNPPVLLLDEPTTGLDAAAAITVMSLMHALVQKRKTVVICTIHQPRSDVFHQFGKVMVLRPLSSSLGTAKNSLYYVGPPHSALQWLESKGHSLPNSGTNVADLLLDSVVSEFKDTNKCRGGAVLSSIETGTGAGMEHDTESAIGSSDGDGENEGNQDNGNTLVTPLDSGSSNSNISNNNANNTNNTNSTNSTNTAHDSNRADSTQAPISTVGGSSNTNTDGDPIISLLPGAAFQGSRKKCAGHCFWEIFVLVRLEIIKLMRSPTTIMVHVGVAIVMGLVIGFLYENMQPDVYGTWNRFLGIFAEVTMFALLGLSAVGTWQSDRVRFLRERSSGYYGTLSYYVSKFLVDAVALRILPVVLFVLCSYSLVGYEHHFNSTYVNSDRFKNASRCNGGLVKNEGVCTTDPLANTSNDQGEWGRSKYLQMLMLSLTATSASAISSLVSALSTDGKVGNFATVLIILILIMFSGALVSNASMPWYVGWLTYISPFAYTFEAMTIGQFQDQCFLFNPTTMSSLFTPGQSGAIACVEVPGYVWLLQFGCTAAGHNITWNNGIPKLHGLSPCLYTYSTVGNDIIASVLLLGVYTLIAVGLYGFCVRDRR